LENQLIDPQFLYGATNTRSIGRATYCTIRQASPGSDVDSSETSRTSETEGKLAATSHDDHHALVPPTPVAGGIRRFGKAEDGALDGPTFQQWHQASLFGFGECDQIRRVLRA
jgi:hypothetical protein